MLQPARRLYRERSAGLVPVTGQMGLPQLDQFFDSTLSRLSGGNVEEGWWRNLLDRAGHAYVAPDVLKRDDLQSWLKDDQVRADFKALAGARMVEAPEAPEIRSRLQERYATITQQPEYLTDEPIEVVVAILLAGFVVDLGPGGALAWLTLESDRQTRTDLKSGFEDVTRKLETLGPDRFVVEVHSRQVFEELVLIKQRRAWAPDQAREQVRLLLDRVHSGDLQHADRAAQSAVLYWAARLHTSEPEHLEEAKGSRDRLRQLESAAYTRIIDALILEAEGDGDGALRMLRDVDDPDARAVFFSILSKVNGPSAALDWFDGHDGRQDPHFLNGLGWYRVAGALAQSGRWEEAAAYLVEAHEYLGEWPDLLFLEGIVNAALLLPLELRRHALEMNLLHPWVSTVEGPEADRHRERATLGFQQAEERMAKPFPERALGARRWQLWLRLTHPNLAVNQAAREEVREGMQDPEKALSLLQVAHAFEIPFDVGRLKNFLDQRAQLGGLEDHELQARFMLAEMTSEPADLIAFLDEEETALRRVLPSGLISGVRIEALVKDGQPAKARSLLEESRDEFEENDRQRLEALIEAHEGKDPRPRLESLYESSHSWEDLQKLINRLYLVKDWAALRPLLEELFQRERTLRNALRLVECMQRNAESGEADILGFLEANQDLVERNPELISARAWALYRVGRLDEAAALNDRLLSERSHPSDLQLEINLACQSGAWERFSGIVEREWAKREDHEPEALIRLASLAAEANKTDSRAVELLRLAAEKGRDDPHVLTAAIGLAYQLGREGEEIGDWLARAAALSSDEGPIKTFNLRTLVEEWMPAHRERRRTIEESWRHGAIPLQVVASELNVPLSYLLIGLPSSNTPLQDGRWRTVIPIVSGAREPVLLRPEWAVGLDVTSLMVLTHLGHLRKAIDSLQRVILAPDTMLLLLNERNRVRFHQPSLVKKAEEILSLIGTGKLREAEPLPPPPRWLSEEVGTDLAQLLQAARESQGHVVRPRPVHRLRSFLDEEAQLGDYDDRVLSTVVLERLLHQRGVLDEATHERAARYLLSQDHGTSVDAELSLLEHPLYLDDLAVNYLQNAGLLHALINWGLDLRVHPSLRQEQSEVITKNHEGEQLAQTIEEIRLILRDAIQTGRAVFLPRREPEEQHKSFFDAAPTLGQFLLDAGTCDALSVDDRYMNKNRILFDGMGRPVSLLCSLDILRHLETKGVLTPDERQSAFLRLRQAGFAFVPLEPEEVKRLLILSQSKPDGTFGERAELRAIRQTLARIRSLDMLQPEESSFLGRLWHTSSWVISQLWIDAGLPVERAVDLTDWVWNHVAPSPLEWQKDTSIEAFVLFLSSLLQPLPLIREERLEGFLAWAEERVLEPLASANARILDRLAELMGRHIENVSEKIAAEGNGPKSLIAQYLLDRQAPSIGDRLKRDEAFLSRQGIKVHTLIGIPGKASIRRSELFDVARRVLARGEDERLLSVEGEEINVSKQEGSIILRLRQEDGESILMPFGELSLLSPDREERLLALNRDLRAIGPTGPNLGGLQHAAAERELTEEEVGELLSTLRNGVAGRQARLEAQLKNNNAVLADLVPNSLDYFERFCGPDPGDLAPEEYLGSVLPEYRRVLLQRNLGRGLEICLCGALRDDLCPGAWLEEVGDDELWRELEGCKAPCEPFSLLGALDIALYRQHDERFQAFAEAAVAMLTAEQFPDADGFDLYQVLPSLAQFVLNRIHLLENGALRAPLWKRMCAWMQASVAIRLLADFTVDLGELRRRLESNLIRAGQYASILDFRRDPMVHAGMPSPATLRGEVVGRLLELQRRHQAADRAMPRADDINKAVVRLKEASPFLPGPLEGHRRPEDAGSVLAEETKDELIKLPGNRLMTSMINLSQLVHFDEETRSLLRETISKLPLEGDSIDPEERLSRLGHAGVVAAAERDRELAQAIARAILVLAPSLREGAIVFLAVQGLLIASAAFEEEGAWADWLREQLSRLAGLLPAGKASSELFRELQELKTVTKLELGITSRAEAIASAGAAFLE